MESTPSSSLASPFPAIEPPLAQSPLAKSTTSVGLAVSPAFWITVLALASTALKLLIALNTYGTNDVTTFYAFSRSLADHGLEWTYRNGVVWFSNRPIFNHPPLTAYYLHAIGYLSHQALFRSYGLTFPFLLRLPGIVADLVVVLVLLRISQVDKILRIPTWALALLAISPVSLMVSGFHGNTDSVLVMFLVLAAYMCLRERPVLCGIFFALSCQVKVIPLLMLPVLFFFWFARGATMRFAISFGLLCVIMWAEPLINFPALFLRNVFSYGSFWGEWGFTYWLRLTHLPQFNGTGAFNLPPRATGVAFLLKAGIVAAAFAVAWRRRFLGERALIDSIAYVWIIFFVFSPGVSVQYMVWLAPFILILSPTLYAWLVVTSSAFLFFFYNTIAGGLPWYMAVSTSHPKYLEAWVPWALWPWATIIVGAILLWKKATLVDSSLRLFSLTTLRARST